MRLVLLAVRSVQLVSRLGAIAPVCPSLSTIEPETSSPGFKICLQMQLVPLQLGSCGTTYVTESTPFTLDQLLQPDLAAAAGAGVASAEQDVRRARDAVVGLYRLNPVDP
jgi:hypothetical protein